MPKWHVQLEMKVNQLEQPDLNQPPTIVDAVVYTCGGTGYGVTPERAIQEAHEKLRGFIEQLMLPKAPPGGES